MEHLEFVEKINESGISLRSTNVEGKEKRHVISGIFGHQNTIIQENLNLSWLERDDRNPFCELVKVAIDMDSWKHSWHNEIKPDNYEKFRNLIQEKIIERGYQIEFLLDVYFLINKAITEHKEFIKNNPDVFDSFEL
jgi:hypothetical protein